MIFEMVGPERWPDARGLLLPAIAWDARMDEAAVLAEINSGMAQLWLGEDDKPRVAVVTCLSRSEAGLSCEIWLLGGNGWRDWLHHIEDIEYWARMNGCVAIELNGRAGWARLLPEYRQKAVILEKAL